MMLARVELPNRAHSRNIFFWLRGMERADVSRWSRLKSRNSFLNVLVRFANLLFLCERIPLYSISPLQGLKQEGRRKKKREQCQEKNVVGNRIVVDEDVDVAVVAVAGEDSEG